MTIRQTGVYRRWLQKPPASALEREVLLQSLIEATVLSALSGLVGIDLAAGASYGGAPLLGVPLKLDPTTRSSGPRNTC